MGGDQLQPGEEDGGTPTEVVAQQTKKILKRRKQENQKKKGGRGALGVGCPITTPIHEFLWWEWVVISYNQEKKMVGHLQKLWHKKTRKS